MVQRSALCGSRQELSNAYFLTKFHFDTAENEPCQDCPTEQCSRSARAGRTARWSSARLRGRMPSFSSRSELSALSSRLSSFFLYPWYHILSHLHIFLCGKLSYTFSKFIFSKNIVLCDLVTYWFSQNAFSNGQVSPMIPNVPPPAFNSMKYLLPEPQSARCCAFALVCTWDNFENSAQRSTRRSVCDSHYHFFCSFVSWKSRFFPKKSAIFREYS